MNVQQRQAQLRQLCESLKEADADLIDVIQFGSSVYAPELARDIDLLVTTRSKEKEELYWDIFANLDLGVDVILRAGPADGKRHRRKYSTDGKFTVRRWTNVSRSGGIYGGSNF
jgi:hypothetical protein